VSTTEPTGFLYPFIEEDEKEKNGNDLLADLAASARTKAAESLRLCQETLSSQRQQIELAAAEMAARFAAGGRLFTFGNGGSATDAALLAEMFSAPSFGNPLPARSLADDQAVVTALGNDIGFELVFRRQLIAFAKNGDVAVGLSTSGNSDNLLAAFAEARRRGLLTIGLAGYDGGSMATSDDVDMCIVVASESIHRIQEAQDAVCFEIWKTVQKLLSTEE
jgi:D-sedoheptulose 7-phosphate isomerase